MSETPHVDRLFAFYEEDLLPPAQHTAVAAHLAACDRCRARLAAVREAERTIAALDGAAPVPDLLPAVLERIDGAGAGRRARRLALGSIVAAVLLAVMVTLAYPPARAHAAALLRSAAGVVAYMRAVVTGDGDGEAPPAEGLPQFAYIDENGTLWRANSDGSGRRNLGTACGGNTRNMMWTPDGGRLLCVHAVNDGAVWRYRLVDLAGRITAEVEGGPLAALGTSVSRDGNYLVVPEIGAPHQRGETGEALVLRADGTLLARLRYLRSGAFQGDLVWGNTTPRLAYVEAPGTLVIYDAATGQAQRLSLPDVHAVHGWVLEDRALLVSGELTGLLSEPQYAMHLLHLEDGRLERFPMLDNNTQFWTAPDGRRLVVHEVGPGRDVLNVVDLTTGEVRPLPNSTLRLEGPRDGLVWFSPDGAQIYWGVRGNQPGVDPAVMHLYRADLPDLAVTHLWTLPAERSAGEPVWPHPSPDGTWVRYLTYPDQPDGTGVLWTQEVATGRRVEIGRGFGFAWRPARPAGAPEVEVAPSGDKPCPIDPEACDFAAQVSRWVLSGNADAIVAATTPEVFRCPQPGPAIGGEFLPCVNAVPGEQRFGYTLRLLGSHGYVADREDYRTRLLNSLVGPAGQPQTAEFRLATLGCPLEGAGVSCRDAFAMVFGQRGPLEAPDRSFLIFLARRGPDGRLTLAPPTIFAPSIPGEDGRALAEGGTIAPPYLEDPVPFGTFHPWTPPEPTSASQRPLPSQPSPADQLEEGLVRFLASLHYHLRMATGEGVACDYRCLPGGSFQSLIGEIRQQDCAKGDPTGVLRSEGYHEARHGELAGAYVAACQLILAPPAWAGALRDSPEWRAVANQAEAMVWEVLRRRAALVVNTGTA